jgi:hypothetical protein
MIEIACIIIAVATCYMATRLNRILKLLEEKEKREQEQRRARSLERL